MRSRVDMVGGMRLIAASTLFFLGCAASDPVATHDANRDAVVAVQDDAPLVESSVDDGAAASDAGDDTPDDAMTVADTSGDDAGAEAVDAGNNADAFPRVRCQLSGGAIYEGCNGTFPSRGLEIRWNSSDGKNGVCPSADSGTGSPWGNCIPNPPCVTTYDAGVTSTMCWDGYCTVFSDTQPALTGQCI